MQATRPYTGDQHRQQDPPAVLALVEAARVPPDGPPAHRVEPFGRLRRHRIRVGRKYRRPRLARRRAGRLVARQDFRTITILAAVATESP